MEVMVVVAAAAEVEEGPVELMVALVQEMAVVQVARAAVAYDSSCKC